MSKSRYTCPKCGWGQYPMLHTNKSGCGGEISWVGGYLKCDRCGSTHMVEFNCDRCGHLTSNSRECVT